MEEQMSRGFDFSGQMTATRESRWSSETRGEPEIIVDPQKPERRKAGSNQKLTGSPYTLGMNRIDRGSQPLQASTGQYKVLVGKVTKTKGERPPASVVQYSRRALSPPSPTKPPEPPTNRRGRPAIDEYREEYHDARPTTRSSKSPQKPLHMAESSRDAQQRAGNIIIVDSDDDETSRIEDLYLKAAPARPADRKGKGREKAPPFRDRPSIRPTSTSRSHSPTKQPFGPNPKLRIALQQSESEESEESEELEAKGDPIQDPDTFDGDHDEGSQIQPAKTTEKKGFPSHNRPKSSGKPPDSRSPSPSKTSRLLIRPNNIPSSGIKVQTLSSRLRGGYCDYRRARGYFRTHTLILEDKGICLRRPDAGPDSDIKIPLNAINAVKILGDEDRPSMLLTVEFPKAKNPTMRQRLASIIEPYIISDTVGDEDLCDFKMFLSLPPADRQSTVLLQAIEKWFDKGPHKTARLKPDACKFHSDQLNMLRGALKETPNNATATTEPVPSDPYLGLGTRKAARKAKVVASVAKQGQHTRDKLVLDPQGKGKPKADPDQSRLPFRSQPAKAETPRQLSQSDARRSSGRLSNRRKSPATVSDTDAEEATPPPRKSPVLVAPVDKDTVLFPYPLTGRSLLTITKGDRWRVQSGEFLNDTLVEWGLRNLLANLKQDGPDSPVHLFNSFFYNKIGASHLRNAVNSDLNVWLPYATVRKWTKSSDIFSKKFIVVPINEDYHWYLAIIYNPGALLRGAMGETDHTRATAPDVRNPAGRSESNEVYDHTQEDENEVELGLEMVDLVESLSGSTEDGNTSRNRLDSPDPIDCIIDKPSPDASADDQIAQGMEDLEMAPTRQSPTKAKGTAQPGKEIDMSVLMGYARDSNKLDAGRVRKSKNAEKPEKFADHDILSSDRTWVITFDSLGAMHKAVHTTLSRWLKAEARDKKGVDIDEKLVQYTHAQVPLQSNFSDCGLFLVHYAYRILSEPNEILRFIERRLPHKNSDERKAFDQEITRVWGLGRDHNLRHEWQGVIASLVDEYERVKATEKDEERSKHLSSSPIKQADAPTPAAARTSPLKVETPKEAKPVETSTVETSGHVVEAEAAPMTGTDGLASPVRTTPEAMDLATHDQTATTKSASPEPCTKQDEVSASEQGRISPPSGVDDDQDVSSSEVTDSRRASSEERAPVEEPTTGKSRDINTAYDALRLATREDSEIVATGPVGPIEVASTNSSPELPPHNSSTTRTIFTEEREELEADNRDDHDDRPPVIILGSPLSDHPLPTADLAVEDSLIDHEIGKAVAAIAESHPPAAAVIGPTAIQAPERPVPLSSNPNRSMDKPDSPLRSNTNTSKLFPISPRPWTAHKSASDGTNGPVGTIPPWQSNELVAKSDGSIVNGMSLGLAPESQISLDGSQRSSGPSKDETPIRNGHKRNLQNSKTGLNRASSPHEVDSSDTDEDLESKNRPSAFKRPRSSSTAKRDIRTAGPSPKTYKDERTIVSVSTEPTRFLSFDKTTPGRLTPLASQTSRWTSTGQTSPNARTPPYKEGKATKDSSSLSNSHKSPTSRKRLGTSVPFRRKFLHPYGDAEVSPSGSREAPASVKPKATEPGMDENNAIDIDSDNDP